MSEEFCTVTRKKWIARRSIPKRPRRISDRSYDPDCPDVDVDNFVKRLEVLCTKMKNSDYFTQAMQTLQDALPSAPKKLQRLVCFGIGPFTRNFQAQHQLAFIISTQRHFDIAEAIYFDPVFRESEKEVLQRFTCSVMAENCEAKYVADVNTLFYLPHCPNCLTNNLLWRNWLPQNLENIVLINNSFESLGISKPERILRLDASYIVDVLTYVKEYPLEDDYDTHNVFNDLSVHVFPVGDMPLQSSSFWAQREAPTYNDVEMIFAEDFKSLSIT